MKILAIGAHPDDFEIGMGGTLAKYSMHGHEVLCLVCVVPRNSDIRQKELSEASKILNVKVMLLDLNSNDFGLTRILVNKFDEIVKDFNPDIVFTHWNNDSHQDHKVVCDATIASTRKNKCSLYMYEQTIPGGIVPYGFRPQMFVDISETIDLKIKSVLAHKSEAEIHNKDSIWENGIKGRAAYRGHQINAKYAEAFEVVKEIKKIESF